MEVPERSRSVHAVPEHQSDQLQAARRGDSQAFSSLVEPYRLELLTYCYRMLGSIEDAEDQVQETFLKAWRRLETYEGRASLRAWLYKIATNTCLDVLEQRPRRSLPLEAVLPAEAADSPPAPVFAPIWIEPYPDDWLAAASSSPEAQYDAQESISIAFMVALQELSARQRSALIFKDVLDWSMAEIADALGVSLSSATSLMYRARVRMKKHQRAGKRDAFKVHWEDDRTRELLNRYLRAWEGADIDGIMALLAEDVSFPMPPFPLCIRGKAALRGFLTGMMFSGDMPDQWKLLPIRANGSPGFALYRRGELNTRYQAFALQVLQIENGLVVEADTFGYPSLFPFFILPDSLYGTSG